MKKFKGLMSQVRMEEKVKSDPCWKGYEMVGMKDKGGKKVPNCVPVKEDLDEQVELLDEMPGANMDTRAVHQHLKRQGWKLARTSGGHDVFTHDKAEHHIAVPRHRQLKAPLVKGILKQSQVREEAEQLDEGRPSQRHPLEGHEYHKKTDAELVHIAKDAHKAAEAMKSHNTDAENKYRDQANDSATVRYYRQKHGMADWYKKKYGHIKEEAEQLDEISLGTYKQDAEKQVKELKPHTKGEYGDIAKRAIERRTKGLARAKLREDSEKIDEALSASARMVMALNREKAKREDKDKAREARGGRFTTPPAQKPTPVQTHATPVAEQTASKLGQEREEVPFDKPYKTAKGTVTDKSGAKHTPMSRAKDLARMAARKQAGLKENSQYQDEVPQDKISTPAKQSLTKTAGIVKDLSKGKGKGKEGPDKFNPDPELSSEIQR